MVNKQCSIEAIIRGICDRYLAQCSPHNDRLELCPEIHINQTNIPKICALHDTIPLLPAEQSNTKFPKRQPLMPHRLYNKCNNYKERCHEDNIQCGQLLNVRLMPINQIRYDQSNKSGSIGNRIRNSTKNWNISKCKIR